MAEQLPISNVEWGLYDESEEVDNGLYTLTNEQLDTEIEELNIIFSGVQKNRQERLTEKMRRINSGEYVLEGLGDYRPTPRTLQQKAQDEYWDRWEARRE